MYDFAAAGDGAEWAVAHATWALFGATIAAFVAAAVAAVFVGLTFWKERRRDKLAQAVTVAAWWEPQTAERERAIRVGNLSDLPIYGVEVVATFNNGDTRRIRRLPVVSPTHREGSLIRLAGEDASWVNERLDTNVGGPMEKPKRLPPDIWIQFCDASNRPWVRDWDGRLSSDVFNLDTHGTYRREGKVLMPGDPFPDRGDASESSWSSEESGSESV